MNIKPFISACLLAALPFAVNHAQASGKHKNIKQIHYEVWASDQSNSVSGATAPGTEGSFLWIWDSKDINRQVAGGRDAKPLACGPKRKHTRHKGRNVGPCDLWDVFPQHLVEVDADGYPTGNRLSDLNGFGRLHGMLPDPQNRYVTANIFAPGGGFVGIIDTRKKAAVALFRVTGTNVGGGSDVRSVHMSFFNADGSQIIVANLSGKVLERIDITRNRRGRIKTASFNRSASLGVGQDQQVTAEATTFHGKNAYGRQMIGNIVGDYSHADFDDLTPNGQCKENGCSSGDNAAFGGRPNNVIICPITSANNKAYVTMGGGGLLVVDTDKTPMAIVGEYGNEVINGAGCGGGQSGANMWINAGVSASGAGAMQSTFSMYVLDDNGYEHGPNPPDMPAPEAVFKDDANTNTIGNMDGVDAPNITGQLPATTTRRDAHGVAVTVNGKYIHNVDRIRNVVEVFSNDYPSRIGAYDLVSRNGKGRGNGPCAYKSVDDDPLMPGNDPAPDLLERTPDGKYLMVAFRGPSPVSVGHSAQGSCPGVGIVKLRNGGASGKLVGVLRTTNMVDTTAAGAPGGHAYSGQERSDVHAATVVRKN